MGTVINVGDSRVYLSGLKYERVDRAQEKRSRHNRRFCLSQINEAKEAGYHCPQGYINPEIAKELKKIDPDLVRRYRSHYNDNYKPTRCDQETWYKSPIEGITIPQIEALAECRYFMDDEEKYRFGYEVRRILHMTKEDIEVELMMYSMGS